MACPRRRCCPPRAGAVQRGISSTPRSPVTLRSIQVERLCNWSVRLLAGRCPLSRLSAQLKPQLRRSTPVVPLGTPTPPLGLAMYPAGMAVARWNRGSRRSTPELPRCNWSDLLPTGRSQTDMGSKPPCHLGRRCILAGRSRTLCFRTPIGTSHWDRESAHQLLSWEHGIQALRYCRWSSPSGSATYQGSMASSQWPSYQSRNSPAPQGCSFPVLGLVGRSRIGSQSVWWNLPRQRSNPGQHPRR